MELLFRFIRRIWQLCQETLGTARTSSPRYLARTWPALSSLVPLGGRRMKFLSSCCGGRCHHLTRSSRSPSSWLRGDSSPVRSSPGTNTSRPCESQTDDKISLITLDRGVEKIRTNNSFDINPWKHIDFFYDCMGSLCMNNMNNNIIISHLQGNTKRFPCKETSWCQKSLLTWLSDTFFMQIEWCFRYW